MAVVECRSAYDDGPGPPENRRRVNADYGSPAAPVSAAEMYAAAVSADRMTAAVSRENAAGTHEQDQPEK
jgi:hypothetical protein